MSFRERIQQFQKMDYEQNKDHYETLRYSQNPHTLFIACSDSRIDAEKLLQAQPGEVFHLRNIANLVTPRHELSDYPSMISTLEYGVKVLEVENIVVCGHSNCGGCAALMDLDSYRDRLPYTVKWLESSLSLKEEVKVKCSEYSLEDQLVILEKANAIAQLDNLMTYSFIQNKVKRGVLDLYALYYDIGSGQVYEHKYEETMPDLMDAVHRLKDE